MTKAEERKLLDKIEALIKSAGEDSYIGGTFRGVVVKKYQKISLELWAEEEHV